MAQVEAELKAAKGEVESSKANFEECQLQLSRVDEKAQHLEGRLTEAEAELERVRAELQRAREQGYKDGIVTATLSYKDQIPGLQDTYYEAGWCDALNAAGLPDDSALCDNIPLPSKATAEVGEGKVEQQDPNREVTEQIVDEETGVVDLIAEVV